MALTDTALKALKPRDKTYTFTDDRGLYVDWLLRPEMRALAEITGEFTADDLLGVIFARFCIGK